jgi:thiol:disulfide interchange protein
MIRQRFGWFSLERVGVAVAVVGAMALLLDPALGQGKASDSKVKASVKAGKAGADGKQTIYLTLAIEKGWYIYANPVGNEDFAANATAITIKPKPQAVNITYPEGELKKDSTVGDYRIYHDQITIPIQVQRAAGDTGSLELSVRVNSCNTKMFCLPPGTLKVAVP